LGVRITVATVVDKREPRRMSARRHRRVVLLVGGDDEVARECARAAAPLPIVRSKHLAVATERLRDLRPVAVYIATDVSVDEARDLGRVADAQATPCIHLTDEGPEMVREVLRR
jgi:hypothetical protein